MLEVCCTCLDDEVVEVREAAATTLSGILRCSPRRAILMLKVNFYEGRHTASETSLTGSIRCASEQYQAAASAIAHVFRFLAQVAWCDIGYLSAD
jgi:hypothetical protein